MHNMGRYLLNIVPSLDTRLSSIEEEQGRRTRISLYLNYLPSYSAQEAYL